MGAISTLRRILNGTAADATDVDYNFQTLETFINTEVIHRDGSVAFTGQVTGVAATQSNQLATLAQVSGTLPVGLICDFGGTAAPSGWVLCDGTAYSSTDPTYAALFAVIGYTHGDAGGGNFNVPDYTGRVAVGAGTGWTAGNTGGQADPSLPQHSHANTASLSATVDIDHGHADTLAAPDHTHGAGSLATDNDTHNHDSGVHDNTTDSSPGGRANASTSTFGSQINTGNDTHSHDVTGNTGGASATALTGSVTDLSTSDRSVDGTVTMTNANEGVADVSNHNYPPYVVAPKIIKL